MISGKNTSYKESRFWTNCEQNHSFLRGYLCLGEFYAETGQKEKALENLKKAEPMFQEMGMDYWLSRTQSALEKLQG